MYPLVTEKRSKLYENFVKKFLESYSNTVALLNKLTFSLCIFLSTSNKAYL